MEALGVLHRLISIRVKSFTKKIPRVKYSVSGATVVLTEFQPFDVNIEY